MSPLASRKQLLIAESELNRAHLVRDLQSMDHDIHALAQQVKTAGSIASMAITLLSWLQFSKTAPAAQKTSWLQTLLKGAEVAASLWSEFRTPPTK